MYPAMNRALFTLAVLAGFAFGARHYLGWRSARRAPAEPADEDIRNRLREAVPASVDVRVMNGIVALRGTAHPTERDRALAYALSLPGVRRVYSDLETETPAVQSQASIARPR